MAGRLDTVRFVRVQVLQVVVNWFYSLRKITIPVSTLPQGMGDAGHTSACFPVRWYGVRKGAGSRAGKGGVLSRRLRRCFLAQIGIRHARQIRQHLRQGHRLALHQLVFQADHGADAVVEQIGWAREVVKRGDALRIAEMQACTRQGCNLRPAAMPKIARRQHKRGRRIGVLQHRIRGSLQGRRARHKQGGRLKSARRASITVAVWQPFQRTQVLDGQHRTDALR